MKLNILSENFITYVEQMFNPILFLCFVFGVTLLIQYFRQERDHFFDETAFCKKYMIAHGMACLFSFCYLNALYFLSLLKSEIFSVLVLALFYGFLLKIVITQNGETGGYIEDFNGASGAIMYITASLSPVVFIFIHVMLGVFFFFLYKREEEKFEWKMKIMNRSIDAIEAFAAAIITRLFDPNTLIECLWQNSIMIAIFTLIIPFINEIVVKFIENRSY